MKKKSIILLIVIAQILQSMILQAFCYDDDYYDYYDYSNYGDYIEYQEDTYNDNIQQAAQAYQQGVDMVNAKAYDTAVDCFSRAIALNPEMTDAYYNIASIYVQQKKYDEAYNIYLKIVKMNPYDYDAILQAAKISYNRKNYALTMRYLKHIPDDYWNYALAMQLYNDAKEMFNQQKGTIERAKVTTATETKKVLIDKFSSPAGMAVDSEGNMYVACYADNSIVKIDKNKKRTNFVSGYLIEGPVGIAIDAYDNLYVANFDANNILKITKGGNVSVFMERISKPYFLYIKNDVLYISEQGNDVVLTYNLVSTNR